MGHIMEQTLQRSYARKSGAVPHDKNNFDGGRWDAQSDFEEVIVDLKGKGRGGSRRASSTGAMPGLPQIGGGGQFGKSPTGYTEQAYPGSGSPVPIRTPGASHETFEMYAC